MLNKKLVRTMLFSLLAFIIFFASGTWAYENWDAVGVPAGNSLMENVYRYEHGDPPSVPSYTPSYKKPGDAGNSKKSYDSNAAVGDFWLRYLTGKSAQDIKNESARNKTKKTQYSRKQLHERFLKSYNGTGNNDKIRCCWAPPTMEEYIRTFFTFKVSDSALRRLCEVQFITNYRVPHFNDFVSRLARIDDAAHGKDATAQITAYAKELEAKAPRIMEEREAWRGKSLNVTTINYQKPLKYCADRGWHYDYQVFKNAADALYAHAKTEGQEATLILCIMPTIGAFHLNLIDLGIKSDLNITLANYTRWLNNYKGRIPCSVS